MSSFHDFPADPKCVRIERKKTKSCQSGYYPVHEIRGLAAAVCKRSFVFGAVLGNYSGGCCLAGVASPVREAGIVVLTSSNGQDWADDDVCVELSDHHDIIEHRCPTLAPADQFYDTEQQ